MYLGIDTSNYTTSVCIIDNDRVYHQKKLLTVKPGSKGLRQSEAVFQHTVNMPVLIDALIQNIDFSNNIDAVGVSARPRNVDGSYMPCFLTGLANAHSISASCGVPLFETSHQAGHILAALYSTNNLKLIEREFIALHLSGGTTEVLLVKPDKDEIIKANIIAQSLDLKAGQAVDRAGVMLGLDFPCGKELDRLSLSSKCEFNHKPSLKDNNISLSGVENKALNMFKNNASSEDIAKFVLTYIAQSVTAMLEKLLNEYGEMPVVFSGGVSGNTILRKTVIRKINAIFCEPQYSSDNALGSAVYALLKDSK